MIVAHTEAKKEYYRQGVEMFLKRDETVDRVPVELEELKESYKVRKAHIEKLYNEVKQIKKLVV